jgi:hypothetical protein
VKSGALLPTLADPRVSVPGEIAAANCALADGAMLGFDTSFGLSREQAARARTSVARPTERIETQR